MSVRGTVAEPPIRQRLRVRRELNGPSIIPAACSGPIPEYAISTPHTRHAAVTHISDGLTIRGIRTAFEDTPIKLRELEAGWRERRKVLAVGGVASTAAPARDGKPGQTAFSIGKEHTYVEGNQAFHRVYIPAGPSVTHPRWTGFTQPGTGLGAKDDRRRQAARQPLAAVSLNRADAVSSDMGRCKTPRMRPESEAVPLPAPIPISGRGPQIGVPMAAPPSPPPTPPLSARRHPSVRLMPDDHCRPAEAPSIAQGRAEAHAPPEPILAAPLPPTSGPVRLTKRSTDTIHVLPDYSPEAIRLSLCNGTQTISISLDGRGARKIRQPSNAPEKARTGSSKPSEILLELEHAAQWTKAVRQEWETLSRLVDGYKRYTPRIRMYLPLGQLVITCSSPPDVILSYEVPAPAPVSGPKPIRATCGIQEPAESGDDTQTTSICRTHLRIRLSRISREVTIDTSTTISRSISDRYRTRRVIRLTSGGDTAAHQRLPPNPRYDPHVKAVEELKMILSGCGAEGWSDMENEAVRRLIALEPEWRRYDHDD